MMIEHVVLFKWKSAVTSEEINDLLRELSELKNKIPGIVSFKTGLNVSERSQGFHAAITSTFVDKASLDAYGPHPEHQKIFAKLVQTTETILAIDFYDIRQS